jgi:hypothetical protein
MELSIALMSDVFKYDPVAKKVREKIYGNKLDPLAVWFIDAWYGRHSNQAVTVKDTGGTNRSYATADYFYPYDPFSQGIGNDTAGIVVGTGSGSPNFTDYCLGARILHGTTAGRLFYHQGTWNTYLFTNPKKRQFVWQRLFRNGSGADITVNEIGYYYAGNYIVPYMFCRDVTGGLNFQNGQSYLVQFIMEIAP